MKKIGTRLTKPRKSIFQALSDFSKPSTVKEINLYLQNKKIKVNLTSIYRTLSLMTKSGIINEIEFGDGKKRYEKVEDNSHHHHLICENCKSVEDISLKETTLLKEVKKQSSFKVKKHSLEFFGLCQNCQ
jgi:Fur family transcriptional regulator, ferric uptake regulator